MGQDREVGPGIGGCPVKRGQWDYEKALSEDKRFEQRLVVKEVLVLILVAIVVAIRVFLG